MKKFICILSLRVLILWNNIWWIVFWFTETEELAKRILEQTILDNNKESEIINNLNGKKILNTTPLNECFDYSTNEAWNLYIKKYKCKNTEIVIPTSEAWEEYTTTIWWWAFEWKVISNIIFPKNCLLNSEAFSWANFSWNITIWENIRTSIELVWFTVSEKSILTIKTPTRINNIINNWKIIYDMNEYKAKRNINEIWASYIFNNSIINWEIEILWVEHINTSFNAIITEKWKIKLWEWLTTIAESFVKNNTYKKTEINWQIEMPSTLGIISNTFNNIVLPETINLTFKDNKIIDQSFQNSKIMGGIKFINNIVLSGLPFMNTIISWDVIISWWIIQGDFSPATLSWDLIIQDTDLRAAIFSIWWKIQWNVEIINTNTENIQNNLFNETKISWDLKIIWDNIDIKTSVSFRPSTEWNILIKWDTINLNWLTMWTITWSVSIIWNDININYWIRNLTIRKNLNISWQNIEWKYWSVEPINVSWDININWTNIDVWYTFLEDSKIEWNLNINSNYFNCEYGCIEKTEIKWNTNITGDIINLGNTSFSKSTFLWNLNYYWNNLTIGNEAIEELLINWNLRLPKTFNIQNNSSLTWLTINKKLILEWSKNKIPNTIKINWWIIIEDWNNATNNIFEDYQITNNEVTIGWKLSTIWEKAYAFKQWTRIINTITLSEEFETQNIWDNALCIKWWNPVKWITKKKYSEWEYQDLLERTCIDLSYNWTHNILLNVEWKEALVVDNWDNNMAIPESLKKSWYRIDWFTDDSYKTWTDINHQSYKNYEYQKTVYGKYIQEIIPSSAWGWSTITPSNKETKVIEQEHNSADTVKESNTTTENTSTNTTNQSSNSVEEKIQTISPKSLTRWELAVFSNILIDIFPKLTEWKKNVNEYCTEYTDYNEFSRKEQKAISKLCRLAIMWIHEDDKTPLETFGIHDLSTNEEFIKVVNRMTNKFSDDELKDLKSALSSLEENKEDNLVFWTVVDVFKKVKELFN